MASEAKSRREVLLRIERLLFIIIIFTYLLAVLVFVAARGLCLVVSEQELISSWCTEGVSLALASLVATHGIFLDRGSNPCSLPWPRKATLE